MCTICAISQTFDPARHDAEPGIAATLTAGADAPETTSTPYRLNDGDGFTGSIEQGDGAEWVAVTLEAGQRYSFDLEDASGTAGGAADAQLRLYDSSGAEVAHDGKGGAGTDAQITYTAEASDTYYIGVDNAPSSGGAAQVTAAAYGGGMATLDTLALQLTDTYWGDRRHVYDFAASNEVTVNLTGLTAKAQQLARWAMEAWEMSANVRFREVSSGEMITIDDENDGAYAYAPNSVPSDGIEMNVSRDWLNNSGTTIDSHSMNTFIHEFGHALGLGHMGDYDGQAHFGSSNSYRNDSWQTSVMSYFDQADNTNIDASFGYTTTPMIADVLAIQNLYGAPSAQSPTAGNTTWGANSTLNNYLDEVFAVLSSGRTTANVTGKAMVFNIYDVSGFDRIDLSYSTTHDRIDLRPEAFSDLGGMIGNLSISRGTTIEALITGSGQDTVTGNAADNVLETGAGADSVSAGRGHDRVEGGDGADTISGGEGNDSVWGGNGRDLIYLNQGNDLFTDNAQGGTQGRDTVHAGLGNDTIQGGNGDDVFHGEDGNDLIWARLGNDTIYGGNNFDTISAGAGDDEVHGGNGRDLIYLNQGNDLFIDNSQGGVLGRDTVYTGLGNDTVQGGNGDDVFFGEAGNDVINARLGNDTVYGGDQFDTISAGAGNDVVHGGNGRDLIYLNQGNDIYFDNDQGGVLGRDTVYAGLGNDTIQGGNGDDLFRGEAGNDLIFGRLGDDSIFGGDQYDTIHAGDGNDVVDGGNGRDVITLGNGADRYVDTAQLGVNGQDTITGGAGADTFVFGSGTGGDIITDFTSEDRLEFSASLVGGRSAADALSSFARQVGNHSDSDGTSFGAGTLFDFGAGQTLFLQGVTDTASLADDIFIV